MLIPEDGHNMRWAMKASSICRIVVPENTFICASRTNRPEYRIAYLLRGNKFGSNTCPLGPMIGRYPVAWNMWEQSDGILVRWNRP
jgi:hypothetical protein